MNKPVCLLPILLLTYFVYSQDKVKDADFLKTSKQFYLNLEYDSAFVYAKKGYDYFKSQKNDSLVFVTALELYKINDKLEPKDSTDYFSEAVAIAKKNESKLLDLELYYAKAHLLYVQDEYAEALPLFLHIDSIAKVNNIKNKTVINAIIRRSEISRLKFTRETSKYAEELLLEALQMAKDIKSEEMVNYTYTYLADVSGLNGKDDEFKRYNDLAFEYYKKRRML